MSKSTGNFLTLRQAIDKFSADGKFSPALPSPSLSLFCRLFEVKRSFARTVTDQNLVSGGQIQANSALSI